VQPSPTTSAEWIEEEPLEPDLPIVDAHHHFWDHDRPSDFQTFLLPELLNVIGNAGHNITHTVFMECHAMYRNDGPEELKPVGEVEFVNGIAAMAASGRYGACRVAGIVGTADLMLGGRVTPVLEALIAAGNGRFRGVRPWLAYSEHGVVGRPAHMLVAHVMADASFRDGVRALGRSGLTLELWCLRMQLDEACALASACPQTRIVLNHLASPHFRDPSRDELGQWQSAITELAQRPNVCVKLGGLGTDVAAPMQFVRGHKTSEELASAWKPYIETGIAAFGPARCMFESNFPPDGTTSSYGALWNAFKRITKSYSGDEKALLFSKVAKDVYRLT